MNCLKSVLKLATDQLFQASDSAALDAEILLCLAIGKERTYLRTWPEKLLEPEQISHFWSLVQERHEGRPIAYITGHKEFWSRDFLITPDVLVPRPDTELLIELCLTLIPIKSTSKLIDLGTGSGIIAITLSAERPLSEVFASDFSIPALEIAKQNAILHHQHNIKFYQSYWLNDIPLTQFDIIVSNPPYIAKNDHHLLQGDLRFEPTSALSSEDNGLGDIKIIIDTARRYLTSKGYLLIEHGYDQKHAVQSIFKNLGYDTVQTITDLSGQPRVTYGQWL